MKAWVDKYGFNNLNKFVSYITKYHNNNILIHNDLVGMVDDTLNTIRRLEVANYKLL